MILIVDDDPDVLALTRLTFECAGHKVLSTTDPSQAVGLAEATPPDAIVMDVMMPGVTGWDLLKELRDRPETRWVPILMLSSLEDTASRVRGLRSGADDYLGKPFEPAELAARVERLIAREGREITGFEGRLSVCPLAEVAQTLEQNARSGVLSLRSVHGTGRIELASGMVARATFEGLKGAEAVRTMLELEDGYFRFNAVEDEAADLERTLPHGLSIRHMALEVAWLQDELKRRAAHLPAPDQPLRLVEGAALPEEADDSTRWVFDTLERYPGTPLQRLLAGHSTSSGRLRLTVAQLVEQQVVTVEESPPAGLDDALERALRDLLQDSVFRGLSLDSVRVVNLVEPAAWDDLARVLAALPEGVLANGAVAGRERLLSEREGAIEVSHAAGHLVFEVRSLPSPGAEMDLPFDTTGVVLWLGEDSPPDALTALVASFDGSASLGVQRLLVAANEELQRQAVDLVGNHLAWRVVLDRVAGLEDVLWGLVAGDGE